MRVALRVGALLLVPAVAALVVADTLALAWGPVLGATLVHLGWTLWVAGPLVLAVCLAVAHGDKSIRLAADIAVGILTLLNLALAFSVALCPWLTLREVFHFLPFIEYSGLTFLLAVPLVIRWGKGKLPKIRSLATFLGK